MEGAAHVDPDLTDIFYDRCHFICKKQECMFITDDALLLL